MVMGMDMAVRKEKSKRRLSRPLAAILALSVSLPLLAQQQGTLSGAMPLPEAGAAGSARASKQDGAEGQITQAWSIKPRLSVSLTATDNASVGGGVGGNSGSGESDLITEISPGLHVEARTARLRGYLDYSLRGQFYAQTDQSRHQNGLNAFATLEAIDNWLFVDASGNIDQQTISAFGPRSASNTSINGNSTETRSFRLSPYIRGTLGGGFANYTLRYNVSTTRANSMSAYDVDIRQWVGQLRGGAPFQNLSWTIDGNSQAADYTSGYKNGDDMLRPMLSYQITPQFSISASAGWERNDYASLNKESHTTHGWGFDWKPTPRTAISAFKERRFFGDGYNFSFSHRFPMSSIRYVDSRNVSVMPNQFGMIGLGSVFSQFYQMFASQFPGADPLQLAQFTYMTLLVNGIDPNRQIVSGFLSSQASDQRQRQLTWVVNGVRNTLTVQFNRSQNSSFAAMQFDLLDDFSRASSITQKGLSVTLAHRLSAQSTLTLTASREKSSGRGYGTVNLDATTTLFQAMLSTKLGAKTTGSLSLRHNKYDSNANPYTENALVGAILYTY